MRFSRKQIVAFVVVDAIVVIAVAVALFLFLREPEMVPAPEVRVEMTEENIARGRYLFENLCDCTGCHSERDFTRFGGPVVAGREGAGFVFPAEMELPGTVVASNITPDPETGIGNWTDGEIIRAIRDGVDRDGKALFPMMPYAFYRNMSDRDARALVAYIRTLEPVRNPLPETDPGFPVSVLIKSEPRPAGSVADPDPSDAVPYGEYLAAIGGCVDCHTPFEQGKFLWEKRLAGGRVFTVGGGTVASANITPDMDTGIGPWSEDDFVNRFRMYRPMIERGLPEATPRTFTLMPWIGLSDLAEADLRAIYRYLRSVPAVANSVTIHP